MLHILVLNVAITFLAQHVLHLRGAADNAAIVVAFILVWPISYYSLIFFERPMRRWLSGKGRFVPAEALAAP